MSDELLVRAFQAGDTSAFEELFMRYQTQALRSAVLITGNYYDGENVLQEAFIKCYRFFVNTVVSAPSARRFSTMLPMIWPHLAASKHHS